MAINSYIHVTPAGEGTKDGTTWAKAMGEAELETFLEGAVVAGDVIFVKEGTYTLDTSYDFSTRDGTAISPIAIIGVKSGTINEGANIVRTDWATGANRPFFDCVTYQFKAGDYTVIRNIYFQGSINNTVALGVDCTVENCKFDQDHDSAASRFSLSMSTYCSVYNNEFLSANCSAISAGSIGKIMFNYIHDCPNTSYGYGVYAPASTLIAFNIFDNIKKAAIELASNDHCLILNNDFYDCAIDVNATDSFSNSSINNIHEGTDTDAYKWTTQTDINFFWNNWGNDARCNDMWDGVDTSTVFKDYPNATLNGDPKFKTAGSDFELDTGSGCLDTGMSITLGV